MSDPSTDEMVAWLEQHVPDAVDDLRLLGAHRFGGDTPVVFIEAAYRREREKKLNRDGVL